MDDSQLWKGGCEWFRDEKGRIHPSKQCSWHCSHAHCFLPIIVCTWKVWMPWPFNWYRPAQNTTAIITKTFSSPIYLKTMEALTSELEGCGHLMGIPCTMMSLSDPILGLPRWLSSRESTYQTGNSGSIPGLGSSPGEENGNPLQYPCLGNPMNRGAW